MLRSFDPVIDCKCKIIILGTMPGVKSLDKQEYYGHERNAFWNIVCSLFGRSGITEYSQKKAFLLEHHIALWDVLKACEREGSLDSNIKNPVPNDFKSLFQKYPNIQAIYFNGEPAEKLFDRLVAKSIGRVEIPKFRLPSTSPANAIRYEQKLKHWNLIILSLKGLQYGNLKSFEAGIGEAAGTSYGLSIDFGTSTTVHRTFSKGSVLQTEKNLMLPEAGLIFFTHRLYENGVLSWKEKYENQNQCQNVTEWYVRLQYPDAKYILSGKNQYPKHWDRFCEDVRNLTGEPFG